MDHIFLAYSVKWSSTIAVLVNKAVKDNLDI